MRLVRNNAVRVITIAVDIIHLLMAAADQYTEGVVVAVVFDSDLLTTRSVKGRLYSIAEALS